MFKFRNKSKKSHHNPFHALETHKVFFKLEKKTVISNWSRVLIFTRLGGCVTLNTFKTGRNFLFRLNLFFYRNSKRKCRHRMAQSSHNGGIFLLNISGTFKPFFLKKKEKNLFFPLLSSFFNLYIMSSSTTHTTSLPPISMFTSRSQPPTTLMPASPPSSGYDKHSSLTILPKPLNSEFYSQKERPELLSPPQNYYGHTRPATTTSSSSSFSSSSAPHTPYSSSLTTPAPADQSTLWALFSQFQQQHQKNTEHHHQHSNRADERRGSDPSDGRVLSSEEVLAEKRRRNAGASARFRDRRKQRERELQDKCNELEQRSKEFENALRRAEPEHPLLLKQPVIVNYRSSTQSPPPTTAATHEDNHTLFDRVGQLEHLMTRFRQEKETDVQKLDELEKEVMNYIFFLYIYIY